LERKKLKLLGTQEARKIPTRSYEFSRQVKAEGIINLDRCYQCSMCSDGCPVAYVMDYYPHQLIHMVRLGLKEEVLKSRAIWVCTSCQVCATRCPNEINVIRLVDVLREASIREGFRSPIDRIPLFHKMFMDEVRKRGRIHELRLLFRYKLQSRDFLSFKRIGEDTRLGLKIFFKGKLKLLSPKMGRQKDIKDIFRSVLYNK
jgi:heterodisulfide reductase subunit C